MVVSRDQDIPRDMRKTYRRFVRWRSSHTGRLPIPEPLWAAAAKLAGEHGIATTAKILRLEYGKLKEKALGPGPGEIVERNRTAAAGRRRSPHRPPAFVELIAPSPSNPLECRVELEGRRGKMRVEFKGIATAELVALSRALWDGEA